MKIRAVMLALVLAGCRWRASEERSEQPELPGAEDGEGEEEGPRDHLVLTPEAIEALGIVTAPASTTSLTRTLEASAELVPDPDRQADIGAPLEGRIVQVLVRPGDTVAAGAPVVAMESPDLGISRADFVSAQARVRAAKAAWERERDLLVGRATSLSDVQRAEAEMQTAAADVAAARARLAALGSPVAADASVEPSPRLVLRTPIGGTVVRRDAHLGQAAAPGTVLVEVVDLSRLWLEAHVYEHDIRLVRPGQTVLVTVRAFPGETFDGVVDALGGAMDERTRAIKVRVVLQNGDGRLRPGMFATARIEGGSVGEARQALAVPRAAVQDVEGGDVVFVREDGGRFEVRRVKVGERTGELVEVVSGVEKGEQVVVDGAFLLKGELAKSELGDDD